MKRLILYLIVAAHLASCGKHSDITGIQLHPDSKLIHIDSLMQSSPDSALQMLLSFRADSVISTEAQRSGEISCHYQSILLSEALYKTDNVQSNRTELQAAIHYFDSLAVRYPDNDDIIMLSARSHYMNGVGYYENDSVVEACHEYLHTLEIMEDHFEEKDFVGYKAKFMGLLYTRLGSLFSNHVTVQPAIDAYKKAAEYFSRIHNSGLANTYKCIGSVYHIDNNSDSALVYYRKALYWAQKQNKIITYCDVLSESAPLFYELGYIDSAFLMIKKALSQPINEDRYLAYYFTYGLLLTKDCQYDSAIYYLEKSINRNQFATKTVSAELLMKCYQALGDTCKMQYYKNIYGEDLDNYRDVLVTEDELANIYKSYKQDKIQKKHSQRIRERFIFLIVFSVFIIIAIALAVIHVKKKIIKVKIKSHDDIKEKDKVLAEMKRKMEANPFISEPICKSILETANKQQFKSRVPCSAYIEYALSKEQLLALKDAMDRHYDNFTQWICKEYPELTNDDIDYLCLYHLGLKDTDIFALMQRAYPTIGERSRKLKRIFNSDEPLHTIIKNIITLHHNNHN